MNGSPAPTQLLGRDERQPLLDLDRRQFGGNASPPPPDSPMTRTSSISSRASFGEREGEAGRVRINALRNSLTWSTTSRSLLFVTSVLLPQVIAAAILLPKYWDTEMCTTAESPLSLRVWILGDAIVKTTQLILLWCPLLLAVSHASRANMIRALRFKRTASFAVDVFAVVWVVQGTNYFFASPDDEKTCNAPHLFRLGQAMYALSMFFMTLPVLLCLLFVPLACCCFPCFVRFLLAIRVTDPPIVGATARDLELLPSKAFDPNTFQISEDDKVPQCAICLSSYVPGEMLRELPCDSRHHFHQACVDDWLKLNATCPVCRSRVVPRPSENEEVPVTENIDSPV